MTTHCWGEKAVGDWVLEIYDSPSQLRSQKVPGMTALLISYQLILINVFKRSESVEVEQIVSARSARAHTLLCRQRT